MVAHGRGQVAPQRRPLGEDAVGVVEQLRRGDADDGARRPLLRLPQHPGVRRLQAGDPRLAVGGEDVADVAALRRPARHRGADAVLRVVGVRGEDEDALDVVEGEAGELLRRGRRHRAVVTAPGGARPPRVATLGGTAGASPAAPAWRNW